MFPIYKFCKKTIIICGTKYNNVPLGAKTNGRCTQRPYNGMVYADAMYCVPTWEGMFMNNGRCTQRPYNVVVYADAMYWVHTKGNEKLKLKYYKEYG